MKKLNQKGITLVALVITIIVLMILAGISLSFVLGDNGILKKAQETADAYKNASQSEQQTLQNIENYLYSENVGDKIQKTKSYVGYYADIEGDGIIDGVIYADKAVGGSESWEETIGSTDYAASYTIPKVTEGLKDYSISQESYTGKFGTKPVISPTGTGEERFYIMALTDIDGKTNGTTYCWYYAADSTKIEDYATVTSTGFGTGKTNTANMIEKWNKPAYGDQDACPESEGGHKDMWGQIQEQASKPAPVSKGWFVPSKEEWAAFVGELGISSNESNEKYYGKLGLSSSYWSSSLYSSNKWGVKACYVTCSEYSDYKVILTHFDIDNCDSVRLSATF